MLDKANKLKGYKLHALDGEIGKVKEFYFEDSLWRIRYLVADTGGWLTGRRVLISPHALTAVNKEKQHIAVNLTKKQIEGSPSLSSDEPVSRQFEENYFGYYGLPSYWNDPYLLGFHPDIPPECERSGKAGVIGKKRDHHLRSTDDVIGHHIQAEDGVTGHVADFIIDDEAWAVRYLIIDTRNWWPGKKILISPHWINRISWEELKVFVNLPRKAIRKSPVYSEESLVTRDYEAALHEHYDRKGYWTLEPAGKDSSAELAHHHNKKPRK